MSDGKIGLRSTVVNRLGARSRLESVAILAPSSSSSTSSPARCVRPPSSACSATSVSLSLISFSLSTAFALQSPSPVWRPHRIPRLSPLSALVIDFTQGACFCSSVLWLPLVLSVYSLSFAVLVRLPLPSQHTLALTLSVMACQSFDFLCTPVARARSF